jgi:hypothetical protein
MTQTYELGYLVRVTGTFTDPNSSDDPIDPTAVKLYVQNPAGAVSELVYLTDTDIVKSGTGVYYADIDANVAGKWYYRFVGTGAAQAAKQSVFKVRGTDIST